MIWKSVLSRRQRWDLGYLFREFSAGHVQIVFPLQIEPQVGAIAEELAKSESHARSYRLLFGQDIVKGLPRHAKQCRDFGFRLAEGREHILAQNRAGMCRSDAFQEWVRHQ